jgi:hypothetical protein
LVLCAADSQDAAVVVYLDQSAVLLRMRFRSMMDTYSGLDLHEKKSRLMDDYFILQITPLTGVQLHTADYILQITCTTGPLKHHIINPSPVSPRTRLPVTTTDKSLAPLCHDHDHLQDVQVHLTFHSVPKHELLLFSRPNFDGGHGMGLIGVRACCHLLARVMSGIELQRCRNPCLLMLLLMLLMMMMMMDDG